MKNIEVEFARDKKAAAIFDIKPSEFLGLVANGHLPKPLNIGGYERWDMEQLKTIARGGAADGIGEVDW